ncbi:MAG TPA: hypothetical protein VGD31_02845, partial [Sphingobacteriaceae bacterium]
MPPKGRKKSTHASSKRVAHKSASTRKKNSRLIDTGKLDALRERERQLNILLNASAFGIWE